MLLKILVLWSVCAFVACTPQKPVILENQDILVGEYESLTGSEATFGLSDSYGIKLAFEEQNAKGGINGRKIRLITYDDQGKPDEAATVVKRLITQDKVILILGEVASPRTLFAAPIAQQYKIPLITPSSVDPKITEVGDFIFRICFTSVFQGHVMAEFAAKNLKLKRIAILKDLKSDYSIGFAESFKKDFKTLGGEIVSEQNYSGDDNDFKAQLTEIRSQNPDGLFIPGYYTGVGLIARQARQLGIKTTLLGGDGWESPKLKEIGKSAVIGSYFSTHFNSENPDPFIVDFVKRFKTRFTSKPDGLSAAGYDAGLAAIQALKNANPLTPDNIRLALLNLKNLQGVTGNISINQKRDAVKSAVVVQVTDDGMRFVTTINP